MKPSKFWVVVLLLLLTAGALHVRGDVDRVPPSTPLAQFPPTIATWQGSDVPIAQEALDVLGKGIFLNRIYRRDAVLNPLGLDPEAAKPAMVNLFIAYFPTQRTGQSIHSPQNCLPGAGWSFESSGTIALTDPRGHTDQVGDYLITDGEHRAVVLYWYQSHGRMIASDYRAKLDMLFDSIRYQRSDAALVRIVSPLLPGETSLQAQQRAVSFAQQMTPLLPTYVPS